MDFSITQLCAYPKEFRCFQDSSKQDSRSVSKTSSGSEIWINECCWTAYLPFNVFSLASSSITSPLSEFRSSVTSTPFSNLTQFTHCLLDCPNFSKSAFSNISQIREEAYLQFGIDQKNQSHFLVLVILFLVSKLAFARRRGLPFRKWLKKGHFQSITR